METYMNNCCFNFGGFKFQLCTFDNTHFCDQKMIPFEITSRVTLQQSSVHTLMCNMKLNHQMAAETVLSACV